MNCMKAPDRLPKIATKTSDYELLRTSGSVYVDKTAYLYRLVSVGAESAAFFIARPRRFGKSLMLSTLRYIFLGRRKLFEGTYIGRQDYAWPKLPVLHLDMSGLPVDSKEAFMQRLTAVLQDALSEYADRYTYDTSVAPYTNLENALVALASGSGSVVVLVDEYDAPIGYALDKPEMAEWVRDRLHELYIVLKRKEALIRFLMMTGVSRFAKTSVFSALNNVTSLTFRDEYATMLGYTEEELEANFSVGMRFHADKIGMDYGAYRAKLKQWFNGYRFAAGAASVYNPVSIAMTLTELSDEMDTSWSDMARPALLVNYLKNHSLDTALLKGGFRERLKTLNGPMELTDIQAVPLLFQTGYLTVEKKSALPGYLDLCIPDEEIRQDVYSLLVDHLTGSQKCWRDEINEALFLGDTPRFLAKLPALYSHLNYGGTEMQEEKVQEFNYQRVLQVLFWALGIPCTAEETQSNMKRTDLTVRLPGMVYIFELKHGETDTARKALQQILDNGYATSHCGLSKRVILIGLAFDPVSHRLKESVSQELS